MSQYLQLAIPSLSFGRKTARKDPDGKEEHVLEIKIRLCRGFEVRELRAER